LYVALALLLGLAEPEIGWRLLPAALARIGPQSAMAMLSAIASGMMALTGIAFSIAFIFFQMSSSVYTPRLLAELARKGLLLHALGIFSGTFVFATLAIRAVGMHEHTQLNALVTWTAFAWLLASAIALALLPASIGSLSIGQVLSGLGQHGLNELHVHYRSFEDGHAPDASAIELARDAESGAQVIVHAGAPLYVVRIDEARLLAAARAAGGLLLVPHAVGDAIMPGEALASVRGAAQPLPETRVREAIALARERTIDDSPAYALRLLADIAIRALSPAINDPTTAVAALDQIEALLRAFGRADLDRGVLRDEQGVLRVVYMHPSWEDLLSLGLTEIAQYGAESVQVQRRLGALLADLAERVPASRRPAVERLLARRERAIEHAELSSEAACSDRQGLGHTLPRP
jgi:uncharacterized membrane protein